MCGIVAEIRTDGSRPDPAGHIRQLRLLAHRGPDAQGYAAVGPAIVGQTRLRIIDLDHGDPPIQVAQGGISVVLNGEIYNFRELRKELLTQGHTFTTGTDTEVIGHLLEEFSPAEAISKLDGMFAIAAWDSRTNQMVLARDRLGEKPLFLSHIGHTLVAASEIKALLAHPQASNEIDPTAIPDYLSFGYVPNERTMFRDISELPPAHLAVIGLDGQMRIDRYWSPRPTHQRDVSMREASELVRSTVESAILSRTIADVPLGAFLSGGIDSSIVVGVLATMGSTRPQTFTIGFEDSDGYDERPYARMVADRFNTDHHEFVVKPDLIDLVETLVYHHDQPFGDSSALPTYLLCQMTKQQVTVALTGDGGDEMFAGYERFSAALAVDRIGHLGIVGRAGLSAASLATSIVPQSKRAKMKRLLATAHSGLPDAYRQWISYISDADVIGLTGVKPRDWAEFRTSWDSTKSLPTLDRLLLTNMTTYLPQDLLVKDDRMSMAHALELRNPFLSPAVVELAMSLPPSTLGTMLQRKRVLKAAFRDLLPNEILHRPKRGFGVPLDRWFRQDLREFTLTHLGSHARIRDHVKSDALDAMIAAHMAGSRNLGSALWTLLTLEMFLEKQSAL